jgi:hypothetical protein
MTGLERRYRRVLRLLPADHRARWEEEMVDTFLRASEPEDPEDADFVADHGRPGAAEVASVVALAVRLRFGGAEAPPRSFAMGEAVRRVALVGLLVQAASALAGAVALPWTDPVALRDVATDPAHVVMFTGLVWVPAYLALVLGARRVAVWSAGLGVGFSAWSTVSSVVIGVPVLPVSYQFLMTVLPVLAMAAFHRDAPPVPVRPWLVALPVAAVVLVVVLMVQTPAPTLLDWSGVLCVAVVVAALTHLLRGGRGPWSVALLVLAVAVLGERVLSVQHYLWSGEPGGHVDKLVTVGVVQAVVVGLVIVPLVLRRRA